jgi:hypothetical protein
LGTLLQEVYDSYFAKVPNEDFTYKSDLVFQYFKAANGYSYKTVPEDLSYSINTNDVVLYVSSVATTDGDILISIGSNTYTISVLIDDSLIAIANKIKNAITTGYIISTDYTNNYPILTIKTANTTDMLSASFVDTGNTNAVVNITKTYDGSYNNTLGVDSIELIALFMASQHYNAKLTSFFSIKQHIGTQNFNKLPNIKDQYDLIAAKANSIDDDIFKGIKIIS